MSRAGACLSLLGLVVLPSLAHAQTTNRADALPEQPSPWFKGLELRTAAGYKDNLLLSHSLREHSLLFANGADVTFGRLPLDGREVYFLLSADDTRYPDGKKIDHEDVVFGLAQVKWQLDTHWRLGLDTRYVYQDQVVDTSVTETNLVTLVRGHAVALLPNLRYQVTRNGWVELSGTAQRQYFQEPLDDFWEGGPKLALGWDYGHRSSILLAYAWNWRAHDTRPQISLAGASLPGTSLRFQQHDVSLAWRHNLDPARRWRTATRLSVFWNADNGPGFYDYRRYLAAPQLRYVAPSWELKTEGRLAYYEFDRQTVSLTDARLRHKTTLAANVRAERKIWKGCKLFAEFDYEEAVSNRSPDQYNSTRAAGGVSCEF